MLFFRGPNLQCIIICLWNKNNAPLNKGKDQGEISSCQRQTHNYHYALCVYQLTDVGNRLRL
jgi:hypothetical protein